MDIALPYDQSPLPAVPEHQAVEFVCPAAPGEQLALTVDGRPLEPFLRPGDPAWRWRWNPGPAVGLHQLLLTASSGERRAWQLRVTPRKIDEERYALLLADIDRLARSLALALGGAATEAAALAADRDGPAAPIEAYYASFEEQLDTLERAARRILARPREQLRQSVAAEPLGSPGDLHAGALGASAAQLQPAPPDVAPELQRAIRPEGGLLPEELPVSRGVPTADFYEHRLLKRLLALLDGRARRIGALAARAAARLERAGDSARLERARSIAAGCADARRRLRELRAAPLLAEVGPLAAFRGPTQLFQRDPAYRDVYRAWVALHRTPVTAVDSPLLDIPIADLPRLYESWCALQAAVALLALGGAPSGQALVARAAPEDAAPDDLELTVSIPEERPLLQIELAGARLTLRYQPRYRPGREDRSARIAGGGPQPDPGAAPFVSLDRHTRVPDIAIEVERPGRPPAVLVLDAKYRLDDGGGVPQDALADAYAYLGAIGAGGARATLGAAILFPGRGAPERYRSDVGAIPLLPGDADLLATTLAHWLDIT